MAGGGVGADGVADQRVNAAQTEAGVGAVEGGERRAGLEGNERADLPAAEQLCEDAVLLADEREFVDGVGGEAVGPVVGGAAAVGATIEGILGHGDFAGDRGVEDFRSAVNVSAPGIVGAEGEIA
jgi:hypothetical protein